MLFAHKCVPTCEIYTTNIWWTFYKITLFFALPQTLFKR